MHVRVPTAAGEKCGQRLLANSTAWGARPVAAISVCNWLLQRPYPNIHQHQRRGFDYMKFFRGEVGESRGWTRKKKKGKQLISREA